MFNFPTNGWAEFFARESAMPYFASLARELQARYDRGDTIYPPRELIFNCFRLTDLDEVKVVIIGQDPYHAPGQAMGLSFSVPQGVKIPPSLENIYREIYSDLGRPSHNKGGDLTPWAKQGVLLLNNFLTVERAKPMSHAKLGWETFTNHTISYLGMSAQPRVFVLWGRPAQQKLPLIDRGKHLVLMSAHPSPLSAYNGFFGSKPFSAANNFLAMHGITPISW